MSGRAGDLGKSHGLVRTGDRDDARKVFGFVAAHQARYPVKTVCRVLGVSRAIVASGDSEDELNVSYEWAAPGVTPVGRGARSIPVAQFAARLGRTVVVTDIRRDREQQRECLDSHFFKPAREVVSIDAVAVKLTVYLGPIARMVASREARHAANFDEFVQRIEDCITDPAQRRQFRHDLDSSR